jgi:hypothetical protein
MPKTNDQSDLSDYAPVVERIALFYERFPEGRIISTLISKTDVEIVFRSDIFRTSTDDRVAATGWAAEQIGDGEINTVACLENTETSAIGRALANLGFTGSRFRASYEEMVKVARVKERLRTYQGTRSEASRDYSPNETLQARADMLLDTLRLINEADRAGVAAETLESARREIRKPDVSAKSIQEMERSLRASIDDRRTQLTESPDP